MYDQIRIPAIPSREYVTLFCKCVRYPSSVEIMNINFL